MEKGIILFVDDELSSESSKEFKLFRKLQKDYIIVPVTTIDQAEKVIKSISVFSLIILDWKLDSSIGNGGEGEEFVKGDTQKESSVFDLLKKNDIHSYIYIYTGNKNEIEPFTDNLKKKYCGRYKIKEKKEDVCKEYIEITKDINDWINNNEYLNIPVKWASAINCSLQKIFNDFNEADKGWFERIYSAAKEDSNNPNKMIISMLNNILLEELFVNKDLNEFLIQKLENSSESTTIENNESISKIYLLVYYKTIDILKKGESSTTEQNNKDDYLIMTGDIFKYNQKEENTMSQDDEDDKGNKYGIIISPECDMTSAKNKNRFVQVLPFYENSFKNNDKTLNTAIIKDYKKIREKETVSENEKMKMKKRLAIFNQNEQSCHLLPIYPFSEDDCSPVLIKFKNELELLKYNDIPIKEIKYRLNSPYINQLRQRYLSYCGRNGVPKVPDELLYLGIERKMNND